MIPSSAAVADSIRKHVDDLAVEIGKRVYGDLAQQTHENEVRRLVELHARGVLLDWFLGEFPKVESPDAS